MEKLIARSTDKIYKICISKYQNQLIKLELKNKISKS